MSLKNKVEKNILPAFKENNIPIVFSSDNNYCPYLAVAIKSLIENSSIKNSYDIIILNEEISQDYKNKILNLISKTKNFSIRFINVNNFIKDSNIFYVSGYFTIATYYKLLIEKICKNYKKIIYLDCDIIVVKDIAKFINIDLENNLMGAVTTQGLSKDPNYSDYITKTLKIPDQSKYFNSGVLLIDILKITKFNLLKKSLDKLMEIKEPIFVDQCILNSVCYGNVKLLDSKYNHYAAYIKNTNKKIIVHYNEEKPWNNPKIPLANLFWKYAVSTDFIEIINYQNLTKKRKIKSYLNYKKTRNAKVAIYTAYNENYDNLIQHKYISKNFDYICFTDKKIKNPGIWEIKPINKTKLDAVRTSRYYKLFPHEILSKYKYSVWVDTNVDVTSDILEKRVNQLIEKKIKIAIPPHFERDCIYQEAKACVDFQKDNPEIILKQVDFLKKEKYPKNNDLFENNLIFREHNDSKIIKVMDDWWWMINNFSRRDQLGLNYVLWKNKLECTQLFSKNARLMSDDFIYKDHNTKIVSTLFIDKGTGFNNDNFIQKIITISNNKYKASFDLSEFETIKQIIFNPLKNQFCKFKITKVKIDGKITPISKIKYQTNGILLDNSFIDFSKTSDPQIIFTINIKIKIISINGNINFYNLENLYINSTNQINNLVQEKEQIKLDSTNQINNLVQEEEILQKENKRLKSDLNKIQSSKTYKIWQKYNLSLRKLKFK